MQQLGAGNSHKLRLPAGMYYLVVSFHNGTTHTEPLVVQR